MKLVYFQFRLWNSNMNENTVMFLALAHFLFLFQFFLLWFSQNHGKKKTVPLSRSPSKLQAATVWPLIEADRILPEVLCWNVSLGALCVDDQSVGKQSRTCCQIAGWQLSGCELTLMWVAVIIYLWWATRIHDTSFDSIHTLKHERCVSKASEKSRHRLNAQVKNKYFFSKYTSTCPE